MAQARRKGARREHASQRWLEAFGYQVIRAAGSRGLWDLLAIGPHNILLVQVKSRDRPGPRERQALAAFRCPPRVRTLIHRWRDGCRVPDVVEVS